MPPPPPPPVETGVREHDGFYLRMGVGIGRLGASFESERSAELGGSVDGSFSKGTLALELAIGGTPAPGLVIGGMLNGSGTGDVTTADLRVNGARTADLNYRQASLGFLGPFVDYYIDAQLGWHLQGALGVSWLNLSEGRRGGNEIRSKTETGGLGFAVGAGWEGFIAKQWSMGALLRLMYASVETNQNDAERWTYRALAFPEVLFSATYH
jgi:hypothetical protein